MKIHDFCKNSSMKNFGKKTKYVEIFQNRIYFVKKSEMKKINEISCFFTKILQRKILKKNKVC